MNTLNTLSGWYNYQKEEYEFIETPKNFAPYLPQDKSAQALYNLYQEIGNTPIEAARKVLEQCVGVTNAKK